MFPHQIHQLWKLLDETQAGFLQQLDDSSLVLWLTQQIGEQQSLSREESRIMQDYIQNRIPLIRQVF
ncbi:MAG: hypothetical protein MUF49_19135 [Oculatellaceae cyanobacterium Prado106]|jgi:hypothetical protein|nr:hypothetical protein [Oculatellaceae cyanobacterium Prado106]